ncbi:MAG: hypothetical protein MUF38_08890 [Anaerolineae bacterium]|nr:hypothetical protein [Anaerolineae bacterium]
MRRRPALFCPDYAADAPVSTTALESYHHGATAYIRAVHRTRQRKGIQAAG